MGNGFNTTSVTQLHPVFFKNFFPLLFFLIGAFAVYLFARTTKIECNRDRAGVISATIIRTGIKYQQRERIAAGELLRAELEAWSSNRNSSVTGNTYRIRLVALNGHLFLTRAYFAGYAEASNKVYQINYFINTPTQTYISITQDDRLIGYFLGAILWIAGLASLFSLPK